MAEGIHRMKKERERTNDPRRSGIRNGVIKTRTASIWLRNDGIVQVAHDIGTEDTLANERELLAAGRRLIGEDQKALILGDIRGLRGSSLEAREFGKSEEVVRAVFAMAILIGSPVSRTIGNFFLSLRKPAYPTRLFTSESEAVDWLMGFVE